MNESSVKRTHFLNSVHKIVGIILIVVAVAAFTATTLHSGGFFDHGIGDGVLTLMMWLAPALSGYFAARRPKESEFDWTQGFWLLVHIGIICRMSLDLTIIISRSF